MMGWVICLMLLVLPGSLWAHKPSDSYLHLDVQGATLHGQWDVALRDLHQALGLDGNGDGLITWGELRTRYDALAAHMLSHLIVHADDRPCASRPTEQLVDTHSDGTYAALRFVVDCPHPMRQLQLQYTLLFDLDTQHRGLLRLQHHNQTHTAIFSVDASQKVVTLSAASLSRTVWEFSREGVWHIWLGLDHVFFLLTLLLPAVVRREAGVWQPVSAWRPAVKDVVRIVSAFTLAHSMTLSLATLQVIALPTRWIEVAIAASVILGALNNLYPLVQGRRWVVALIFGLIHGLGFSNVLGDLGLAGRHLLFTLLSFNIGVEAGQLVIVTLFFPLAFGLRHQWLYQRLALHMGSLLIAGVAAVWLLRRSFEAI